MGLSHSPTATEVASQRKEQEWWWGNSIQRKTRRMQHLNEMKCSRRLWVKQVNPTRPAVPRAPLNFPNGPVASVDVWGQEDFPLQTEGNLSAEIQKSRESKLHPKNRQKLSFQGKNLLYVSTEMVVEKLPLHCNENLSLKKKLLSKGTELALCPGVRTTAASRPNCPAWGSRARQAQRPGCVLASWAFAERAVLLEAWLSSEG